MTSRIFIGVVNPMTGANVFDSVGVHDDGFSVDKKIDEMKNAVGGNGAFVCYDGNAITEESAHKDFNLYIQWASENPRKMYRGGA